MYQYHREFRTPTSDLIIWRYMDLWKFLDLIENQRLYLTRSDCFDDKTEGTLPINIIEKIDNNHPLTKINNKLKKLRETTFISSWTFNEKENYPMWKIYTDFRNAVAIKTTVGNLINSLKEEKSAQYIGVVKYMPEVVSRYSFRGNLFQMFMEKLPYYNFENEIRVISSIAEEQNDNSFQYPKGIYVNVNFRELLGDIYLAPLADINLKKIIELKLHQILCDKKKYFSEI